MPRSIPRQQKSVQAATNSPSIDRKSRGPSRPQDRSGLGRLPPGAGGTAFKRRLPHVSLRLWSIQPKFVKRTVRGDWRADSRPWLQIDARPMSVSRTTLIRGWCLYQKLLRMRRGPAFRDHLEPAEKTPRRVGAGSARSERRLRRHLGLSMAPPWQREDDSIRWFAEVQEFKDGYGFMETFSQPDPCGTGVRGLSQACRLVRPAAAKALLVRAVACRSSWNSNCLY